MRVLIIFNVDRIHAKYYNKSYDIFRKNARNGEKTDMTITATEFKKNSGMYMLKALEEDIYITKNGEVLVKLSNPNRDKIDILNSLVGAASSEDLSLDEIKKMRLSRQ